MLPEIDNSGASKATITNSYWNRQTTNESGETLTFLKHDNYISMGRFKSLSSTELNAPPSKSGMPKQCNDHSYLLTGSIKLNKATK